MPQLGHSNDTASLEDMFPALRKLVINGAMSTSVLRKLSTSSPLLFELTIMANQQCIADTVVQLLPKVCSDITSLSPKLIRCKLPDMI